MITQDGVGIGRHRLKLKAFGCKINAAERVLNDVKVRVCVAARVQINPMHQEALEPLKLSKRLSTIILEFENLGRFGRRVY